MKTLIHTLLNWLASRLRQLWHLSLEYLALRHQVEVLKRSAKRPQFSPADRGLWLILSRLWFRWPQAVEIMQVDTVKRWRRQGFWCHFGWRRGRKRPGRPPIPSETRNLIREMSRDNHLWGVPRIHGELLKLGIGVDHALVLAASLRGPQALPLKPCGFRPCSKMNCVSMPTSAWLRCSATTPRAEARKAAGSPPELKQVHMAKIDARHFTVVHREQTVGDVSRHNDGRWLACLYDVDGEHAYAWGKTDDSRCRCCWSKSGHAGFTIRLCTHRTTRG